MFFYERTIKDDRANNDIDLIKLIKRNDVKALEVLFNFYYKKLCKFAFNFLNDIELSEEAVSDVFYKIWEKRGKIEIVYSVRAYLFGAVKNQSLNILKKKKHNFQEIDTVINQNTSSYYNPANQTDYNELVDNIEKIVEQLPPKRQKIFRMSRFEGLKYKEIALILDISVNTVQNQMVEAIKFLSKKYNEFK